MKISEYEKFNRAWVQFRNWFKIFPKYEKYEYTQGQEIKVSGKIELKPIQEWICVVEAGDAGGNLHAHFAIPEYRNFLEIRYVWEKCVGLTDTNCNVKKFFGNIDKATYYMAKYMTKSGLKEIGARTFRSSKGLEKILKKEGYIQEAKKCIFYGKIEGEEII